jgi:phosphoglycerate dehydrogenase-like enzyme
MAALTFTTSAGIHADALAEFAVLGVLAGAKDLPRLQSDQAGSRWPDRWQMRQAADMTVLVLGLGGIGMAVCARLAAFGIEIWGASRSGRLVPGVSRIVPIDELSAAVPDVDAIVVTLPGTDKTHHLVGERVLRSAKRGVIVVNVGRGSVIDEAALLEGLADETVSYAALDVYEKEPLPAGSPLWQHPRVLVSPHTAAVTEHEELRIVELFADNARRLLDGEQLRNVVDTVEFS